MDHTRRSPSQLHRAAATAVMVVVVTAVFAAAHFAVSWMASWPDEVITVFVLVFLGIIFAVKSCAGKDVKGDWYVLLILILSGFDTYWLVNYFNGAYPMMHNVSPPVWGTVNILTILVLGWMATSE